MGAGYHNGGRLAGNGTAASDVFRFGNATLINADCFDWLAKAATNSVEAVVTDPPYGLSGNSEIE